MLEIFKRQARSITFTLVIMFVLPLIIFSIYALIDTIGDDSTGKYIQFTNIAFAFFAGISTLMFNWARSLDDKLHKAEIKVINHIAEYCILGGIGYLLSSLLQFVATIDHNKGIIIYLPKLYLSLIPLIVTIILSVTAILSILIIVMIFWMYLEIRSVRKINDTR